MRSLEWRDVDLRERKITLRRENSKNKKPRVLPLGGRLLEIVQEQHDKRRDFTCTHVGLPKDVVQGAPGCQLPFPSGA